MPDDVLNDHTPRAPGSEARLRGLDWAMPDDVLNDHTPQATESEARLHGLDQDSADYCLKNQTALGSLDALHSNDAGVL